MMCLLRLTLLFATLLGMALLTAPDATAATPVDMYGPVYGEAHVAVCDKTYEACYNRRERCHECVRSCRAAYSTIGKPARNFAERCRTRIRSSGVW